MKLSDVVAYLNHLDQDDLQPDFDKILSHAAGVLHSVTSKNLQIDNFSNDLDADFNSINQTIKQFENTMLLLKSKLKSIVQEQEPEYYAASQRLYEDEMIWETNEYILERKLSMPWEERNDILNRIKLFTDWRTPGMILRPGKEDFIESLVPLDPLYLIDQHEELIAPSVVNFDEVYRRRLRQYVVDDRKDQVIFQLLPDNQFGFVFAYNYFNYKPLNLIVKYLDELYTKLRPGGRIIFTYNDCDFSQAVILAERSFMCYTPGQHIKSHAKQLGFEIEMQCSSTPNAAWLELKKPGEIESLRGGQALAKIIPK
jgi:hypothetical protein